MAQFISACAGVDPLVELLVGLPDGLKLLGLSFRAGVAFRLCRGGNDGRDEWACPWMPCDTESAFRRGR